eukprot:TRINITY_DN10473_c0_g1_i1.p1 TRINITY_DN10473_c0_g1~~TRINITY_DN10473_c0_g1_i1.p1  ORF type:complete len:295 (+),score=37.81 TRINITY_DN10473_c0_g1_i1:36-920(+)
MSFSPPVPDHLELLLPRTWEEHIHQWLKEDIPSFDYGAAVVGNKLQEARLLAKDKGILAGSPFFTKIFEYLGCTVHWNIKEGSHLDYSGTPIVAAIVRGPVCNLLQGERVALNLLSRASGIATRAKSVRKKADEKGFKGVIAGTRKTTPGFRLVEKYALQVGGCDGHRMDLSSMIMLKDNHIWSSGNITQSVHKARMVGGFSLKIEVECRSQAEAEEAIRAGADVVMLDNFSCGELKTVAATLKKSYSHVMIEASGGITVDTVGDYICPDVDIISMGTLVQGVPHIDFSLKIVH